MRRLKSCGKEGRLSRIVIRDLVQGREVESRQAHRAIIHVEKCVYCRISIESTIKSAKEQGHETNYLESFRETLREAWDQFEVARRIRRERE